MASLPWGVDDKRKQGFPAGKFLTKDTIVFLPRRSAVSVTDEALVAALSAFAHALRLHLWRILVPYGPDGLSAGRLADMTAQVPSSLSFHLQQMTRAGILVQRRTDRRTIYAANPQIVDEIHEGLFLPALRHDDGSAHTTAFD